MCINIRQSVAYIRYWSMTFIFDLNVYLIYFINMASCTTRNFCLLWQYHIWVYHLVLWHSCTIFSSRVYHNTKMLNIHSWPVWCWYLVIILRLYFYHEFASWQVCLCHSHISCLFCISPDFKSSPFHANIIWSTRDNNV